MKKFIFVLFIVLTALLNAAAQERYEIQAESLTIFSEPNAQSTELGKMKHGVIVEVHEFEGDWARISFDGGHAYLNKRYLQKCEDENRVKRAGFRNDGILSGIEFDFSGFSNISMPDILPSNTRWMAIAILILSVALFIFNKIRDEYYLVGALYHANWIVFLILSILELTYAPASGSDSVWFCTPDEVGWGWTIVNFFIFGGITINQFICFMQLMNDLRYAHNSDFDLQVGLYSWAGILIATLILSFLQPEWIPIAIGIFLICQLIQVIIIIRQVMRYNSFWKGAFCALLYLICSIATAIVIAIFVTMILIIIIVLIILCIIGSSRRR